MDMLGEGKTEVIGFTDLVFECNSSSTDLRILRTVTIMKQNKTKLNYRKMGV